MYVQHTEPCASGGDGGDGDCEGLGGREGGSGDGDGEGLGGYEGGSGDGDGDGAEGGSSGGGDAHGGRWSRRVGVDLVATKLSTSHVLFSSAWSHEFLGKQLSKYVCTKTDGPVPGL